MNIHQEMWNRAPTPNRYASPSELDTSIFSQSIMRFFLFSLMTKPLNTQNEWVILMLIGPVAIFRFVSFDV